METNTTELKDQIFQLINATEDNNILNKVQAYLITLQNEKADWWELASIQEKEIIYKSRKLLDEGKGIPHNEVKDKVDMIFGRR